jgi:dolichol-phosphate mannosyltransferase
MRALIAIPLFNEENTVAAVLKLVQRFAPHDTDVLIINDGSTDDSGRKLAGIPDIKVLSHDTNQGYGASLIDGFHFALKGSYDAVLTMDCDEQHEPHLIPELVAALDTADIISGSRYLNGSDRGCDPPPDRLRINRQITEHINAITGFGITDAFCGFKAYRADALRGLRLDEPSYGMPLQVWIQAFHRRFRVREIPIGRIYKSFDRQFWGGLNDPVVRLRYYQDIIDKEVRRWLARSSS